MRKLSYCVAVSIDGFIGGPDGDAVFFNRFVHGDFLDHLTGETPEILPTAARRHFGVDEAPNRRFDTIIQGRRSYDLALEAGITRPYAHLRELVASRSLTGSPDPRVEIVSGDLVARVAELKREDGLGIYLCGGANLAGQLRDEVDELVLKTYPVVLGSGMPMFDSGFQVDDFALDSLRAFDNGVVVRTYRRER
ncbi:dihydrofolate reductase family protein [Streptomyces clavuligerus]|uniref:dihydrofolate reductase family protein n=1 Tax=Streptomyces clavuligerus TaxID=1901 RepID=UPI00017FF6B5|nr:dihydrofolate reductase family protein [Streptomyces clavuligerus]ANW18213.1 deaminase [Streptomyces clavuligerus]AXU12775.1 dihydrofolate reductase [Streptomyces clavuligerus]EDY48536.1 dihydrofolate reductase [Streptomyces clavuligerus]MBY6302683.1 dihydrofolate reductase family protein [Streptomyces clavuligerus]QCS05559.1 deaminase [Streptomyces clavuligerus]